nr:hypothetical protein [Tanacetum cinerariifolium]
MTSLCTRSLGLRNLAGGVGVIVEAESLEEETGHLEIEFVVKKLAVEPVTREYLECHSRKASIELRFSTSWRGNSLRLQPWRTYALSSIIGLSEPHVPKKKRCIKWKKHRLAYENLSTLLLQEASFSSQFGVWHSHMDLPSDPSRTIHDCIGYRPKAWILMCSEFVIQIMIAEVVPRLIIVAPTENL